MNLRNSLQTLQRVVQFHIGTVIVANKYCIKTAAFVNIEQGSIIESKQHRNNFRWE